MKNRRHFLSSTAALAAGAWVAPHFAIGQAGPAANSKVKLAVIGCGGRGAGDISGLRGEDIVAMADVDFREAAPMFKEFPKAKKFEDYREMLDKMGKDIDAVLIATPDHSHFPATMAAMELGKHVFTEKPLAHNVWQCRILKKAARHYKVVSQMGIQGHATAGIRMCKEWYEAGILGEVKEVDVWIGAPDLGGHYFGKPTEMPPAKRPVPEGVNWDLWLGPHVGEVDYNDVYLPRKWRSFFEFGNALLGDWACHTLDSAFWVLDLGMPESTELITRTGGSDKLIPEASLVQFNFPARGSKPPVTLRWHEGLKPPTREEWGFAQMPEDTLMMTGDKACLMHGPRPESPRLARDEVWQEFRKNPPTPSIPRVKGSHYQEWIDAIRGDGPTPGANFDYSAELTEMVLIGVLAQRFGGKIEYDAATMRVTNRPELNAHLKEPAREGFRFGENLG